MRVRFGSRHWGSPRKRRPGIHLTVTEAQSLDEALDIIKDKQRPHRPAQTIKQIFGSSKVQRRKVSLPMGMEKITPLREYLLDHKPAVSVLGHQMWSKAQVLAAMQSGDYKLLDVIKLSQRPADQIRCWLYQSGLWVMPEQLALTEWQHVLAHQTKQLRAQQTKSKLRQTITGSYFTTGTETKLQKSIEKLQTEVIPRTKKRLQQRLRQLRQWR